MSERKIELSWVCTSCRHRNRGRDKVCAACGDAKDASERFEMPVDTAAAASVTDPALLEAARAGADWRCTYCRSDNRAPDARCRRCGSARGATPASTDHLARSRGLVPAGGGQRAGSRPPSSAWGVHVAIASSVVTAAIVVGVLGVLTVLGAVAFSAARPRTRPPTPDRAVVRATVTARAWETHLRETRLCLAAAEGFAEQRPVDAVEITPAGMRHHHDDRIEDGLETETYEEDVPYQDVETYTEMVPCGQDCVDIPQTCSESCTDDGNGFATCSTTCTGGGQSCTPRTCPETRTRPVMRTRRETRTRQVPHYRIEPRDAPWFRWRAHQWQTSREASREGSTEPLVHPSEADLGEPRSTLEGCTETRLAREETYTLTLATEAGHELRWAPPSVERFEQARVGASVEVEVDAGGGLLRVLE
jgi:hypothetical protein